MRLVSEVPIGDDAQSGRVGVIRELDNRDLTNERGGVGHLVDIGKGDEVLAGIRHIETDEVLVFAISDDAAFASGAEIVEVGTSFDRDVEGFTSLSLAEVVFLEEIEQSVAVEGGETVDEISRNEGRNKEGVGEQRDVHVAFDEIASEDAIEESDDLSIGETFETRTSGAGVIDDAGEDVGAVEKTFFVVDADVGDTLDEVIPTSEDAILVDLFDRFLKGELLHLFEFDETEIVSDFISEDRDAILGHRSVDPRDEVAVVPEDVAGIVHDTGPIDGEVFDIVDESAASIDGDVFGISEVDLRGIGLLMELSEGGGQEREVGVVNPSIVHIHTLGFLTQANDASTARGGKRIAEVNFVVEFHLLFPPYRTISAILAVPCISVMPMNFQGVAILEVLTVVILPAEVR